MLKALDIKKNYIIGDKVLSVLKGISFHLHRGEFMSVMGPSGAGKSTCLHILGCLDRPSSGFLEIDSINTFGLSDSELASLRNKKIGFVFQSFNLLPKLTAFQNVELPLIYAGVKVRKQICLEALDSVGLLKRSEHRPSELSGGEQQRVAIARALVNNPAIILADEPTGNLDTKSGRDIMNIFDSLNALGRTILMITHDRKVAEHGDRIIHLKDGIVEYEEPSSGVKE